jgi:hypothetical protein
MIHRQKDAVYAQMHQFVTGTELCMMRKFVTIQKTFGTTRESVRPATMTEKVPMKSCKKHTYLHGFCRWLLSFLASGENSWTEKETPSVAFVTTLGELVISE